MIDRGLLVDREWLRPLCTTVSDGEWYWQLRESIEGNITCIRWGQEFFHLKLGACTICDRATRGDVIDLLALMQVESGDWNKPFTEEYLPKLGFTEHYAIGLKIWELKIAKSPPLLLQIDGERMGVSLNLTFLPHIKTQHQLSVLVSLLSG